MPALARFVLLVFVLTFSVDCASAQLCERFGPQTPRDIDDKAGNNPFTFSFAPDYRQLNLCNIHFHKHAEHQAEAFSKPAKDGEYGGYRCNETPSKSAKEMKEPAEMVCTNVAPGDTIEVHWVHTSCDIDPGPGLGACVSESCGNPNLRVEAQVFLVVDDPTARDFTDFVYDGNIVDGFHQAKAIPSDTGDPIHYLGSATAPDLSDTNCSNLQVSWGVRPQCARVNIGSLSRWCASNNIFGVTKASGVRKLITAPELLSTIE